MTKAGGTVGEGAGALLAAAASPSTQDALQLLRDDHRRIEAMLADCEKLAGAEGASSSADRSALVSRLGALVIAHGQMEQQLFYPALKADPAEIARAVAEHEQLSGWLEGLAAPDASGAEFSKRLASFADTLREHLRVEEQTLFPKTEGLDLQALGTELAMRRGELLGDQGID